jgi:hypothetical protein
MYAVNTRFRFRTAVSDNFRQAIEQVVRDQLGRAPGFRCFYAVAVSEHELVTFHVWENQSAAQQGLHLVGDWIREHLEPALKTALERRAGEVVICLPAPRSEQPEPGGS